MDFYVSVIQVINPSTFMHESELHAQLIPNPHLIVSFIKWGSKPMPNPNPKPNPNPLPLYLCLNLIGEIDRGVTLIN